MKWKWCGRKQLWLELRYYPSTCLQAERIATLKWHLFRLKTKVVTFACKGFSLVCRLPYSWNAHKPNYSMKPLPSPKGDSMTDLGHVQLIWMHQDPEIGTCSVPIVCVLLTAVFWQIQGSMDSLSQLAAISSSSIQHFNILVEPVL